MMRKSRGDSGVPRVRGHSCGTTGRQRKQGSHRKRLDLRAAFTWMRSTTSNCAPGTPPSHSCYERTGEGVVRGLGRVTQSYIYLAYFSHPSCTSGSMKILSYPARFAVAGKGEIHFALAWDPDCLTTHEAARNAPQSFTITGGPAPVRARGSGRVEREPGAVSGPRDTGTDRYIGTLAVPGLEFDLTAPTISGARSKTLRTPKTAKRVRVTFRVTAQDDVDGVVRVSCSPASGSRFKVGRTTVKCSVTDTSGNTAAAQALRITVRRGR